MGAWGAGSFENDTACDWAEGLKKVDNLSLIASALGRVLGSDDYLDSDVASKGLAACEVVARLKGSGGPSNPYTETVDAWVRNHPITISSDLIQTAIAAIDRILAPPSELLELWQEGDDTEWQAAVADLRSRVQG